jgi:hypothetical protein
MSAPCPTTSRRRWICRWREARLIWRMDFRRLRFCSAVGWVEPFAKPIILTMQLMGIASLHPSYELTTRRQGTSKRSPDESAGRANARPMTGSATSGFCFYGKFPHVAALMRATCSPTGKSEISCPAPFAKRFLFSTDPNHLFISRCLVPSWRGVSRSSQTLGAGCGGRGCAIDEQRVARTAKSCGPDAPTLASSS